MRVLLTATAITFAVWAFPAFAQGGGGCSEWCRDHDCVCRGVSEETQVKIDLYSFRPGSSSK
jgi:hypothetical protein